MKRGKEEMTFANIWFDFGILDRGHGEGDMTSSSAGRSMMLSGLRDVWQALKKEAAF